MRIDITTPALLFPAISLLMLAYTNRFLGLATVIRRLHQSHSESPKLNYIREIEYLRTRIRLIRDMQSFGVLGLILCTSCMFLIFRGYQKAGEAVFGASMVCLLASLVLSFVEIRMSGRALDLHLMDLEKESI
ncbi:MAG: DUF2721 domain-containing protein [Fibrobacterota bacterium]|nr:DUF2721 domain-containing protein [Fibrobacterota bacterium]